MSENVKLRQQMERRIVRKVIEEGKKQGYCFNVNNGGDTHELPEPTDNTKKVLEAMFATDDEHLVVYKDGKRVGWVYLIYGNGNCGLDVISDYTTTLEPIMPAVNALVERYND